jgi:FMN phosphatase YigB (HAD superfamily)
MSRAIHQQTWGLPLDEAIQLRSPGIDVAAFWQTFPLIHAKYIHTERIDVVTEENLDAIDKIRANGIEAYLLTSRRKNEMAHLLDPRHPLTRRLDGFYHWDNMKFHKPDPRAFDHIETDHGLKPKECVYIGDSVSDAIAATGAGLVFIANLESGLRSKEDFSPYPVFAFVNRFADVASVLATPTASS